MKYEKSTEGILVKVSPQYSLADSAPDDGTFVFLYQINMENEGAEAAQLLFRHWLIHDAAGHDSTVDGEGVVGEQPVLEPGGSHQYQSYCVLRSPAGYMEGYYTFERDGGEQFRVEIPRFQLNGPLVLRSGGSESFDDDQETGLVH